MRGGLWLSLRTAVNTVVGLLYWLLMSLVISPEQVGMASAVVTMYTVVTGISFLGMPSALQKFIGSSLGRGDKEHADRLFWSALTFLTLIDLLAGLAFMVLGTYGISIISFSPDMMVYTGLLTCLGWSAILDSLLIAHQRVKANSLFRIAGNVVRLISGLALVFMGMGWLGAVLGYLLGFLTAALGISLYSIRIISLRSPSARCVFKLLKAGVSIYLPNAIRLVGQHASVLAVYGVGGGFETGPYYMAYMGATIAIMFSNMLFSYLIPVLSRMEVSRREELAYRVTKLGMLLTSLIAAELFSFPEFFLGFLGKGYLVASTPLRILSLAATLSSLIFVSSVVTFVNDKYLYTLSIGLASSVPRLILYFYLAPAMGSVGASLAFLIGAVIGIAFSMYTLHRIGFRLIRKDVLIISFSPFVVGALLSLTWPPLGVLLIPIVTLFAFMRAKLLKKGEIKLVVETLAPGLKVPSWLVQFVFGS